MNFRKIIPVIVLCVLATGTRVDAQSTIEQFFNDDGKKILLLCYPFADNFTEQDREWLHKVLDTIPCREERVSLIFVPYRQDDCAPCSTIASEYGGHCVCMDEAHRRGYGLRHAPSYNLLEPSGGASSFPINQLSRLDLISEHITAPPGKFSIRNAWWSNRADLDRDGFYGSDCNLCWDANVSDEYTRSMIARISWRLTGSVHWNSLDAIPQFVISGDRSSDTAFVTIPSSFQQGSYDFRIELCQCGEMLPKAFSGPETDTNLAAVQFEPDADDMPLPKAVIVDAFWPSLHDADGDGYYRTGSHLGWTTYVEDTAFHWVEARIYADTAGAVSDTPVAVLSYYCVYATESVDTALIDLLELDHQRYDFRIELIDDIDTSAAMWYLSMYDLDLQSVPLERASEDIPLYSIADVRWSDILDDDGDGYWRNGMHLVVNAGFDGDSEYNTRAVIFCRSELTEVWDTCAVSECFEDLGADIDDTVWVKVRDCNSGRYDFRVDIYACTESSEILASYGPSDDLDLQSIGIESTEEDEATLSYSIGAVRWTGGSDIDQDGFASGVEMLEWDTQLDGTLTGPIFARVYHRRNGTEVWELSGTTESRAPSSTDTMIARVSSLEHGEYDFKIMLFELGKSDAVASVGPEHDAALKAMRIESVSEDRVVPQYTINDARWSTRSDIDNDGYYGEGVHLVMDVDAIDEENRPVQANISYRQVPSSGWHSLATTDCIEAISSGSNDQLQLELPRLRHGSYDFKIDLIDCEHGTILASRGPSEDRDIARVQLETREDDKPYKASPSKAGRVFVGLSGGIHMIRMRQNSEDTWLGLASFGGAIRQIGTVGLEAAAFYSDTAKIFEGGMAGLDLAPTILAIGDVFSLSVKLGAIWLSPNRIGPDLYREKIDYISPYFGCGVFLGKMGGNPNHAKWRFGISVCAIYSDERQYYETDDLEHPDNSIAGGILILGGPSGGISLQLEF